MIDYQEVEDLLEMLAARVQYHEVGWCEASMMDRSEFPDWEDYCDCKNPETHSRVQKVLKDIKETKIWSESLKHG
jgi:hypothetical protein